MPDVLPLVARHGYWVLALVVLLENAGVPVPGETALLAAGYLSSPEGGQHFHLMTVVVVTFFAAVAGDNFGFLLGRQIARPRLAAGKRFLFLTPARMTVAERYFHRYGPLTVFFARFVTGLRVIAGPAAGASGMRWGRFVVANAAGASLWAVVMALLGYYFGHAWEALQHWLGRGAWAILAGVVTVVVGWRTILFIRRRQVPPDPTPKTA